MFIILGVTLYMYTLILQLNIDDVAALTIVVLGLLERGGGSGNVTVT